MSCPHSVLAELHAGALPPSQRQRDAQGFQPPKRSGVALALQAMPKRARSAAAGRDTGRRKGPAQPQLPQRRAEGRQPSTKRQRQQEAGPGRRPGAGRGDRALDAEDEEIASDFSSDGEDDSVGEESDDGEDAAETADQKRLRLAKKYLEAVKREESASDEDDVEAAVENRLTKDVLQSKGRYTKRLTRGLYTGFTGAMSEESTRRRLRGHGLSVTCLAMGKDDATVFSGSKDCTVIAWDTETGQKKSVLLADKKGRKHQVLAVAASDDGRLIASGGHDRLIQLWDVRSNELLGSFSGHRDSVRSYPAALTELVAV